MNKNDHREHILKDKVLRYVFTLFVTVTTHLV